MAIISVGADNRYGHPTDELLERLAQAVGEENIYRTDRDGTIRLNTDGNTLWLVIYSD